MSWIFYALLSAVFASLVAVFGKVGIANIDSTLATAVRAVIMAVFLALTAVFMGKMPELSSIDSKAILYIVFSGVAGALSWLFYFYALRSGPVAGVASLDRLSLVFAIVFAALFLGERISWGAALGAALMVGGAMLVAAK
jgi:transporter family protein